MQFFTISSFVIGKKARVKSQNLMKKPTVKRSFRGGDEFSMLWSSVGEFEQDRSDGSCLIVSCSFKELKCVDQPSLVISSEDLNCKSFCTQLGKVLLEKKSTICVENHGLNSEGSKRLLTFLDSASVLFDSRVRIIIYGPENSEHIMKHSEKHFVDKLPSMNKKLRIDNKDFEQTNSKNLEEEVSRVEKLLFENLQLKEENEKIKHEAVDKVTKLSELEFDCIQLNSEIKDKKKELNSVHEKVVILNSDLEVLVQEKAEVIKVKCDLEKELKHIESSNDLKTGKLESNLKTVNDELSDLKRSAKQNEALITDLTYKKKQESEEFEKRILELKREVHYLKKENEATKTQVNKVHNDKLPNHPIFYSKLTQTDPVIISPTPLSVIKAGLERNKNVTSSAVGVVHKTIRDLKYLVTFTKVADNISKCEVQITKGHNIMKYPQLTQFVGLGNSESQAKIAAFDHFILSVAAVND